MITIVTGIPRSGTSLIMQMLQKGGMEILTDNVREADESNPKGYFEYEKVKSLQTDSSWLLDGDGKAVKIIAQLLKYLLLQFEYKVIFIERNMEEILLSQQKMLKKMGQKTQSQNTILSNIFKKQIEDSKTWLETKTNISTLYIKHTDSIFHAQETANQINEFLGLNLNEKEMTRAVDKTLYRQRAG